MGEPEYLDTAAVARLLGLQPSSISRYRRRPESKFPEPDIILGGHPGWRKEAIEVWAATRRRPGRPSKQPSVPDAVDED